MEDTITTVVYTNCIKKCREEMRNLPVNHWSWKSNQLSIHEYVQKLHTAEPLIFGTYTDNHYRVVLIDLGKEEEQVFVSFGPGECSLSGILDLCKLSCREISKFYDCRFRIKNQLYVIYWRYKDERELGRIHHGEPCQKANAEDWAEYGNKNYPEIKHWVEPYGK